MTSLSPKTKVILNALLKVGIFHVWIRKAIDDVTDGIISINAHFICQEKTILILITNQ